MRLEISAGGLTGSIAIAEYQSNFSNFVTSVESMISSFKAVKNETHNLSGGVGNLQDALENIDTRIRKEEEKKADAVTVQKKSNDFLELAVRVDRQVATLVNQNKEEFYRVNPWLRPAPPEREKAWYEKAWDAICDVGKAIGDAIGQAWNWVKDTAGKIWDGLVEFYETYKLEIINWGVTLLCVAGSILAIALIPASGGASIALMAGVSAASSAIISGTRNITSQYEANGTLAGLDWKSLGTDMLKSAVVGGVTGAIGAGVGGAITSGLSSTAVGSQLLTSSSALTRVTTGVFIGGVSEVGAGIAVRGAGSTIDGIINDNLSAETVLKDMFDYSDMITDATIGGAFGGITEYKQYKSDITVRNYNEVNDPINRASERGYEVNSSVNGTLDYSGTDYIKKSADGREIIVDIKATGSRSRDFSKAWETAEKEYGINKSTFDKVTWQHMDNYNVRTNTFTLQLVDSKAHSGIKHAGGCKQYEVFRGVTYK